MEDRLGVAGACRLPRHRGSCLGEEGLPWSSAARNSVRALTTDIQAAEKVIWAYGLDTNIW